LAATCSTCISRADVLTGAMRDEQFMEDLSRVVNGTALPEYLDPARASRIDASRLLARFGVMVPKSHLSCAFAPGMAAAKPTG
jgi:hypothetical protein